MFGRLNKPLDDSCRRGINQKSLFIPTREQPIILPQSVDKSKSNSREHVTSKHFSTVLRPQVTASPAFDGHQTCLVNGLELLQTSRGERDHWLLREFDQMPLMQKCGRMIRAEAFLRYQALSNLFFPLRFINEGTLKTLLNDNQLEDMQRKPLKDKHGYVINGFKDYNHQPMYREKNIVL